MAKSIYDIDPSKIKIAGKDWDDERWNRWIMENQRKYATTRRARI